MIPIGRKNELSKLCADNYFLDCKMLGEADKWGTCDIPTLKREPSPNYPIHYHGCLHHHKDYDQLYNKSGPVGRVV